MKKIISITITATIAISLIVYAAKVPTIFGSGVEGFLKTKAVGASWTNVNGWVIFKGLDAKSQIQLTKANGASILVNDIKQIKQKGKITGDLANILVGTSASDMADPTDVVYGGNKKFCVKLKGVNLGTVISKDMRMVLINSLNGILAGNNVKGIKIMTQDGDIMGTPERYAKIGLPEVPTTVKTIKLKKGCIGYLDLLDANPAKPGKTKIITHCPIDCDTILRGPGWNLPCAPPWPLPIPYY